MQTVLVFTTEGEGKRFLLGGLLMPLELDQEQALEEAWEEWFAEDPTPDCDSMFISWCVGNKGWKEVPNVNYVEIEV